jgi:hypothetical protein
MSNPPIRVECKWCKPLHPEVDGPYFCSHEAVQVGPKIDVVTAKSVHVPAVSCRTERTKGRSCGPEGRLWEP